MQMADTHAAKMFSGALSGLPDAAAETPALPGIRHRTDLSVCLFPLLDGLGWQGNPRHVAEALPHFTDSIDLTDFRNVMAKLCFSSEGARLKLADIDHRLMPCLFLPDGDAAMVPLERTDEGVHAFDGASGDISVVKDRQGDGTAYFFRPIEPSETRASEDSVGWFRQTARRFRVLIYQSLAITLILNGLALATPLFVMAVYDKVVATGSLSTLMYFAIGVVIAISSDIVLRALRAKIAAFVSARLDTITGSALFGKIIYLPPALTERSTVGSQIARIKEIEMVREFLTGPMILALFELPFVFLFIIVIALIGGPVAFVPVVMVGLYVLFGGLAMSRVREAVKEATHAGSRRQEFMIEVLSNMRGLKQSAAVDTWLDRFRDLSAAAVMANLRAAHMTSVINALSHVLMVGAGAGTIVIGVFRVFDDTMTIGALIATMILTWRVLAPLQTAFLSLPRLAQAWASVRQINTLMRMPGERQAVCAVRPLPDIQGWVEFSRVSLRYVAEAEPALVGVSFQVAPGEVVGVIGDNGSGKSTILKLLSGMYAPQAGSVRIDGMDIRQMDPIELRHAIAYVPQTCQFFYGTIAQNLRLADPLASQEDLIWAAERANVLADITALSSGFDTRIGDATVNQLPTSFQQKLNLARGFLKRAPVFLFDEPGNGLDMNDDKAFMDAVRSMKGKATVFIVTHRPSHLAVADKILWLDSGYVRAFGPVADVMPKYQEAQQ